MSFSVYRKHLEGWRMGKILEKQIMEETHSITAAPPLHADRGKELQASFSLRASVSI